MRWKGCRSVNGKSDKRQSFFEEQILTKHRVDPYENEWFLTNNTDPAETVKTMAIRELKDKLFLRLRTEAFKILTDHQVRILTAVFVAGQTESDYARETGMLQTAVQKALYGQHRYNSDGTFRAMIGGAIPRLRKWAETDEEIQKLLLEIKLLATEVQ